MDVSEALWRSEHMSKGEMLLFDLGELPGQQPRRDDFASGIQGGREESLIWAQ